MNKKLAYLISVGAFMCCAALIVFGLLFDIDILVYAGVVLLFGGGLLLSIVCVIVMFARARKQASEMDKSERKNEPSQNDEEYAPNRYSEATSMFAYSIHGFRHSSVKKKILMILFLLLTVGSVFAGIILLFFRQMLAAYICFGIFGGTLLIGILAAVIASHSGR